MTETGKYKFGGTLKKGKDFYYTDAGQIAVEFDHRYLVEPTQEERTEIEGRQFGMEKEGT